jgi:hypothetical protein
LSPSLLGAAYGFAIHSEERLDGSLTKATSRLPSLAIEVDSGVPDGPDELDGDRALITLACGRRLAVERRRSQATIHGRAPQSGELAHPLLGAAASVMARWRGGEVFHAGVFETAGQAICLLGDNHAGKSTTLAALAARGHAVLADDLAFTDGTAVNAGPRHLDLRGARLASGHLQTVREDRVRMRLGPAPARLPIGGWVLLEWGEGPALEPVDASELLPLLAARRALRQLPSDPATLLELAAVPAWRLRRPREWTTLDASIELLRSILDFPAGLAAAA